MSKISPPAPFHISDYEAIETALLESTRGRWFLSEFSRRNRTADTQMLLDAITKLESAVIRSDPEVQQDNLRHDLIEMAEAISQTRQEIAAITSPDEDNQLINATSELDAIVQSTEQATSDILEAAEDVQEVAWLLRENGGEDAICDRLEQRATDIYTACSFQDITGQRTGKVVDVLCFLEKRVKSMVEIWGLEDIEVREIPSDEDHPEAHLLNGPQLDGQGLDQSDIDEMIDVTAGGFDSPSDPEPAHANGASTEPSVAEAEPSPEVQAPPETQITLPAAHSSSTSPSATSAPVSDSLPSDAMPADPLPETEPDMADAAGPAMEAAPAVVAPPDETPADPLSEMESDVANATGPAMEAAPAADIPAANPSNGAAESDVISADSFEQPADLELDGLDAPKTAALFI